MDSPDYIIPNSQLQSNYNNFLIVLAWLLLLLWIWRILRSFHLLYRLNVAVSTGQVCACVRV